MIIIMLSNWQKKYDKGEMTVLHRSTSWFERQADTKELHISILLLHYRPKIIVSNICIDNSVLRHHRFLVDAVIYVMAFTRFSKFSSVFCVASEDCFRIAIISQKVNHIICCFVSMVAMIMGHSSFIVSSIDFGIVSIFDCSVLPSLSFSKSHRASRLMLQIPLPSRGTKEKDGWCVWKS